MELRLQESWFEDINNVGTIFSPICNSIKNFIKFRELYHNQNDWSRLLSKLFECILCNYVFFNEVKLKK